MTTLSSSGVCVGMCGLTYSITLPNPDLGSQHGDQDHCQNLITCFFYHPEPLHKISSQLVHSFLNNVVNRQTNKQTNRKLNKLVSFAKEGEVKISGFSASGMFVLWCLLIVEAVLWLSYLLHSC